MKLFSPNTLSRLAWLLLLGWLSVRPVTAAPAGPFLFTSFHDADQKFLRYLYSYDGYHWTNVPGTFLAATVGAKRQFRDPSLSQGPDGVFHLVWTSGWHGDQGFGCASSRDLIHWSPQQFVPVMTNTPTTVNVWAPELFRDDQAGDYLIAWASTIPGRYPDGMEKHDNNHRLFYTRTRDFQIFAPAREFYDPGFSVIDPFLVQAGGRYVLVCKDNSRPNLNLRVAFGATPTGPWTGLSAPLTEKFTEGPGALKVGDDWLIYFDAYRGKHFGALRTHDFKSFTDISQEVSFPPGHKHGTAIKITTPILDALLESTHITTPYQP